MMNYTKITKYFLFGSNGRMNLLMTSASVLQDCFVSLTRKIESSDIDMANEIKELMLEIDAFTQERDWDQFHNPKDLALALSIEASELLEAFLWKRPEEAKTEQVKEELADVFNYAFLIASKYGFDIATIVRDKLQKNAEKYPVEKAKGVATKYNEL